MKKNWKLEYTQNIQSGHRNRIWHRKMCHACNEVTNDIWMTEWNYQIKTRLEHLEKTKPTNTCICRFRFLQVKRLTPSNKWKWKTKFKKNISGELENYSRQKFSGNLIKGINTWAVPLVRYSGPFLEWTRDELKQMDQRTRKLMTMHKALHPRDDVDILYL